MRRNPTLAFTLVGISMCVASGRKLLGGSHFACMFLGIGLILPFILKSINSSPACVASEIPLNRKVSFECQAVDLVPHVPSSWKAHIFEPALLSRLVGVSSVCDLRISRLARRCWTSPSWIVPCEDSRGSDVKLNVADLFTSGRYSATPAFSESKSLMTNCINRLSY